VQQEDAGQVQLKAVDKVRQEHQGQKWQKPEGHSTHWCTSSPDDQPNRNENTYL